jgi:hypothetical protein
MDYAPKKIYHDEHEEIILITESLCPLCLLW